MLVLVGLGVAWLRRSTLGTDMLAVRANERSAAATGINVSRTKLAAFGIGAFIAGLGGSLLGYQQTLATPESFTVFLGISLFAVMYIAGITSITGGILAGIMAPGGLLYIVLDRAADLGEYYTLISGILLIVSVMTNPDGIASRLPHIPWPTLPAMRRRAFTQAPSDSVPDSAAQIAPPIDRTNPLLAVDRIGVRYGAVVAAEDVSFGVYRGEIVGLIGPNGAGKTTVIDAVTGFAPSTGTVSLDGRVISTLPPHVRSRTGLGRSFQDVELYDDLSVAENVTVGASRSRSDMPVERRVAQVLEMVGLDAMADAEVATLSQGRRQLVSVARVLAASPVVALLDEPAAGLDSTESQWLGERLRMARDSGTSILMVDHDMDLVLSICDRVVVLDLGRVIATGTPEQIRNNDAVIRAYLGMPGGAVDLEHKAIPELHPPGQPNSTQEVLS